MGEKAGTASNSKGVEGREERRQEEGGRSIQQQRRRRETRKGDNGRQACQKEDTVSNSKGVEGRQGRDKQNTSMAHVTRPGGNLSTEGCAWAEKICISHQTRTISAEGCARADKIRTIPRTEPNVHTLRTRSCFDGRQQAIPQPPEE